MQYFTEQASSHREAIDLVRSKYGDAAQILSHRSIRVGGFMGLFAREGVEVTGYLRPETKAAAKSAAIPDLEEEKRKILAQARADQALQQVLAEIQGLRERLDRGPSADPDAEDHETLRRVDALLALNDFSEPFRRETLVRLRRDFSIDGLDNSEDVEEAVLEWIGDSIEVWKEPETRRPRILALVGPTGVGKTTTIAKLAAIYTVGMATERPLSVRMITIDNYRIGARQQIETYGNIMGVPVSCVETAEDLRKTIAFHSDADLILVDTVGKSPRDAVKLAEMQRILAACGSGAETHLALAATTKASDMVQTLRQFEPFDYKAVVLTKVDETNRLGNAISALAERRKPLSYITTGQRVPQDIERVRVTRLLMNLEGFRVDRSRLEERYGETVEAEKASPETRGKRSSRGSEDHQSSSVAERQLDADRS
ncbi:MAG: flagellar biosynthesis protein FlhF [Rectinemataceae bacterium]